MWAVVLLASVVGVVAAFIGVGPDGVTFEAIGAFFALPLGVIAAVAVGGLRGRWDRGFAAVAVIAAALTVVTAGLLYAAIGVGQGLGALLTVATGQSGTNVEPTSLLGITAVAAIVAGVGCLFGVIVGPPRRLVVDPEVESLLISTDRT